jgi:hypothetical protein
LEWFNSPRLHHSCPPAAFARFSRRGVVRPARLDPVSPETRSLCDEGLGGLSGDPLPYIVFGFLEASFLTPAVKSGKDAELLARIFQFFEQMAANPDVQVANLLYVGLFETWVADAAILKRAFRHMGPATENESDAVYQ